ncbi:hypothetical protein LJC18_02430 [Lachnospiraceae bacterium OttesenSCG-928-E19]|nr:hypothetical protein [Lachnospiraceae bacterium OttesenSCG-928-E19]
MTLENSYYIASIGIALFAFFTLITSIISLWNTKVSNANQQKIQKQQYDLTLFQSRYQSYKDFYHYGELLNENPFYQFKNNLEFMEKIKNQKKLEEVVICELKLLFVDKELSDKLDDLVNMTKNNFDKFTVDQEFKKGLTGDFQKDAPILIPLIAAQNKLVEDIKKTIIKLLKIS